MDIDQLFPAFLIVFAISGLLMCGILGAIVWSGIRIRSCKKLLKTQFPIVFDAIFDESPRSIGKWLNQMFFWYTPARSDVSVEITRIKQFGRRPTIVLCVLIVAMFIVNIGFFLIYMVKAWR